MITKEIRANEPNNDGTASDLTYKMALMCARECVRSAVAVIKLIYERQLQSVDSVSVEALPAWCVALLWTLCRPFCATDR
jgi:hypothetical protein